MPATNCPVACYTHTIYKAHPPKACPTVWPLPICAEVCAQVAARGAGNQAAAPTTTITVVRTTVETIATVTATFPGHNPACVSTATVTVTTAVADGAYVPSRVCPLQHQHPDCGCGGVHYTQRGPSTTTVVEQTVLETATEYETAAPLICKPLPTAPPITVPIALPTPADVAPPSSSETCASYMTTTVRRYCLQDARPTPASSAGGADLPETYINGCTVVVVLGQPCSTLGSL